ncbi:HAD family acid phosphatase [Mycoplasma procyoni]|uniref:HAD family acid phosphatase n=1 Tax=Mycoplasma procyoni TaxID=568784 RepID=UPI001F099A98|nr:HAD family acid phosphatase [Mycoplasma procyoni]
MAYTLYNSAIKQYDALVDGQSSIFEKDKVKVEGDKVTVKNTSEGKSIPVVFMDIDETVLNNYAYQNWLVLNKKSFSAETWDAFVQDKKAVKIAGAIEFIKHVWSKGGVVMFNSNREQENQLTPTKENLVAQGLDAKYMPKWIWWMQGVDLSKDKPWDNIKKDDKGKRVKSYKEERMNLVSSDKKWDLSAETEGANAVSFKVVMRVGDNFDDFNDIASKDKLNPERNKVLDDTHKLFGNFDVNTKGVKYTKGTDGKVTKADETWAESYVLIGGNSSYGGWEAGLAEKYYSLTPDKQAEALKKAFDALKWK